VGLLMAMLFGGLMALVHGIFSIHLRADQIVSGFAVNLLALGVTGYLFSSLYPGGIPTGDVDPVPKVTIDFLDSIPAVGDFLETVFGDLSLLVWIMFVAVILSYVVLFKTPIGLRIRSVGEHPRAADTVGISVYVVRYAAVITSGVLAALGGAFLSIGFVGTFSENMTSGRGYIALAAVIFGKWDPLRAALAGLLSGAIVAKAEEEARAAGATILRGVWGYHGDHEPHGDRLLHEDVDALFDRVLEVDPAEGRRGRPPPG
jgi:simple sugar transport system permease protein